MAKNYARWLIGGVAALLAVGGAAAQGKDEEPKREGEKKERITPALPFMEIKVPAGHAYEVVFSPDGKKMAVGAGTSVTVWNVADGKELVQMHVPEMQLLHRVAFAADGKTLVWNGREDPMVRIFDLKTGRQAREFPQPDPHKKIRERFRREAEKSGKGGEGYSSSFLCYSPDGTRMVYRGENWTVEILDIATGKIVAKIEDGNDWNDTMFSPDGKQLALFGGDRVRLWDVVSPKLVKTLGKENGRSTESRFRFVSFSPNGQRLATWSQSANSLDVWDLRTGKRICTIPAKIYFMTAQFSRDNQSILGVTAWSEIMLHNIVAEKTVHRFSPPEHNANFAAFTSDEKKVVILGPSSDAKEGRQYSVFVYDLPAQLLDPAAANIDDVPPAKLWEDLQTDNDPRLQLVLKAYRSAPKQAVALFRKETPPVSKERQKQVEAWIAELDDPDFTTRGQAMKRLQEVAHTFAPLLEARLKAAEPGEIRNRLTTVLKQRSDEKVPVSLLRESRVVTLLEQMATPEARELLTELAQGASHARLTVEARAALERLAKTNRGAESDKEK